MANSMHFPPPLNGQLTCPAGSMPKIKVQGGVIAAECCAPPSSTTVSRRGQYTTEFKRWALATITEDDRYLDRRIILAPQDEEILRSGHFILRGERGERIDVWFRLPEKAEDEGGAVLEAY